MAPYALRAGEGWTFNYGIPHTVKIGELAHGRGAGVFEYLTRKGEEPPEHTHMTEDEIFYVLEGEVTFHCGGEDLPASTGSFIFLPRGIRHGYTIKSAGEVRLLAITFPTIDVAGKGWGGYLADVESQGEPLKAE
jgi:quercetin dioxygenase-like cupin family protein